MTCDMETTRQMYATAHRLLCFCFFMLSEKAVVVSSAHVGRKASQGILLTKLCVDKCETECRHYQTPFETCFHGAALFPDDPSWNSTVDIIDKTMNATHFRRTFHEPGDSCRGQPSDDFILPFQVCVGPFGKPRPWGVFQLLSPHESRAFVN